MKERKNIRLVCLRVSDPEKSPETDLNLALIVPTSITFEREQIRWLQIQAKAYVWIRPSKKFEQDPSFFF